MVRKSLGDERSFVEKADHIKLKMAEMSTLFIEVSKLVRELHIVAGDTMLVENLLKVRADIAPADTRLFNDVADLLTQDERLGKKTVSPETLRALSILPHETRNFAVAAVLAGQLTDTAKLHEIESFAEQLRDGGQRSASLERNAYFEELAQALVPHAVMEFEALAGELVEAVRELIYICQSQNSMYEFDYYSEEDYARAHKDIQMLAALVLADFEILFGKFESFLSPPENDIQANMMASACRALLRFVEGRFGHEGGFAFDEEKNDVLSLELFDAVRYLCTWPTTGSVAPKPLSSPLQKLHVLEFGAGAGGMAIGLMAAGFQHVALLEKMNTRVKTLKSNWPSWPIGTKLISEFSDEELERHRGIDLLAGSIPGYVFASNSKPDKRGTGADHFPDAVRAVRLTKPRSFIFGVVKTVTYAQHAAYFAEVCSELTRLGYRVEQISLTKNDFGLPQKNHQLLLVGVRSNETGTFVIPSLVNPIRRSVSEVIGPALIQYEAPLKDHEDSFSPQATYNAWARDWSRWNSNGELIPFIPVSSKTEEDDTLYKMRKAGINDLIYSKSPPQIGEVKDNHFLPRLTASAVARLQGFPEKWSFKAKLSGNVDMIAEAIPPILARAVGLSIYQALTETRVDLDRALREPIINERQIGEPLPERVSLSPAWYTRSRILKAAMIMDREDELRRLPDPIDVAGALNTYMAELVPMKRGKGAKKSTRERSAVEAVVERTRLHRELDCFPSRDSYPIEVDDTDR